MNNKRRTISTILITAIITFLLTSTWCFMVGPLPLYGILNANSSLGQRAKINQVKELIKKYYIEDVEDNQLLEGAIRGVAASLQDPYTVYLDEKDFDDLKIQTQGSYGGIGVVVSVDPTDNLITVIAPLEDTPGEKAGILPGDKIIKVNDKDVWGDKLEEAVSMMKGPKNTEVVLTVLREDLPQAKEITIERDIIVLETIKHKVIDNDIGYIRITTFDEKTASDFKDSLNDLYDKDIKGLIIDVRDNPGGLMDQVVKIADYLVPEGIIVYTEDKYENKDTKYSDKNEVMVPLAVLINGGSASASEILAGAIKDHEKGSLIGTKTYGKGVVQTVIDLLDGTALKLTVSQYFTPNGTSIHDKGIEPDIIIELPPELKTSISQIEEEDDTQLQKAIEVVKSGL